MDEDAEFTRKLDHLRRSMADEEHERTWRDREVTAEDARRAMTGEAMSEDRDRALVVIAVSSAAVFVGGLVSQGVAWSLALRLIVALGSLGVLCWQLVKWTDGDDEP